MVFHYSRLCHFNSIIISRIPFQLSKNFSFRFIQSKDFVTSIPLLSVWYNFNYQRISCVKSRSIQSTCNSVVIKSISFYFINFDAQTYHVCQWNWINWIQWIVVFMNQGSVSSPDTPSVTDSPPQLARSTSEPYGADRFTKQPVNYYFLSNQLLFTHIIIKSNRIWLNTCMIMRGIETDFYLLIYSFNSWLIMKFIVIYSICY